MFKKVMTAIIIIAILVGIIYVVDKFVIGNDGFITKASNVEIEYNKKELLNEIKTTVNSKYIECYNTSKEDENVKFQDLYNANVAIETLMEKGYLEYYYYSSLNEQTKQYTYQIDNITDQTEKRNDIFYLNVTSIKDINQFGKGEKILDGQINYKDVFLFEKKQDEEYVYVVNYYNINGEKEEIGKINLNEPM